MAEYRIKTTTNYKGETIYIPQEGYVRSYGHWNPQKEVVWIDLPLPGQEFSKKETASACLRLYMQKSKAEFIEAMKQSIAAVNKAKDLILKKEAPPTKRQMQYIEALQENTGVPFKGITRAEASAYIDQNKNHPGNQNEWALENGY